MLDKKKLVLLSLNELNFEAVKLYDLKEFPNLKKLVENYRPTNSENEYEKLEPWIQWLTIYTGLSADEHGIFRLGDIKKKNLKIYLIKLKTLVLRLAP